MTGWVPSRSVEAELAIRTLNRVRVLVSRGRLLFGLAPGPAGPSYRSELNEVGIVRAFSVLESFLTDRGDSLFRRDLPVPSAPSAMVKYAHSQILRSFRGDFERGPVAFWKSGLGVELATFPRWQDVEDYRQLRNTITHALGYVRPGGSKMPQAIERRLRAITLDPSSFVGRIPIADRDFDDIASLVLEFVLWADGQRP